MPDLPTVTVTQTQADRILAAFQGVTDETGAAVTPQQAYKRWLSQALREKVLTVERVKIDRELDQTRKDRLKVIEQDLPV